MVGKKLNDLGIPEVKEGTVIMCEGVEATGFNWVKVEYIRGNFRVKKNFIRKLSRTNGALVGKN